MSTSTKFRWHWVCGVTGDILLHKGIKSSKFFFLGGGIKCSKIGWNTKKGRKKRVNILSKVNFDRFNSKFQKIYFILFLEKNLNDTLQLTWVLSSHATSVKFGEILILAKKDSWWNCDYSSYWVDVWFTKFETAAQIWQQKQCNLAFWQFDGLSSNF